MSAAETIKIAFIDVLSGPFGLAGAGSLSQLREVVAQLNERNGAKGPKLEIVPFDGKGSPQESVNALLAAKGQGIRYITQGGGSNVAYALVDAISKIGEREPDKSILYLNFQAMDTGLTNEKCSYWHFRFYPTASMQLRGLVDYLVKSGKTRKLYLINQNYSYGQTTARDVHELVKASGSKIEIVGDDLVPLAQVKDFTPYLAKIKAAGADTIITSNWGADLALLLKSARTMGSDFFFYTLNGSNPGVATQLGDWGTDKVANVGVWSPNSPNPELERILNAFKKKTGEDFLTANHWNSMAMLLAAVEKAGSSDPRKVAPALEGLKLRTPTGEAEMRAKDHQLQGPIQLMFWGKQGANGVRYDMENTGYGWRPPTVTWSSAEVSMPTTCEMRRPQP